VRRSKLHTELVAGRPVTGLFAPSGADFATPGILSWTEEQGAELQLVDLSDPWPSDFGDSFTVHGKPHTGDEVTLLRARVQSKTAFERTTHITSGILALGDHSDVEERWPIANYSPASLHEWIPDTGLSIEHNSDDNSRLVVAWNAPEQRDVTLSGATISLSPGADWAWSYSPGWSIETSMKFTVRSATALTIEEYWAEYGNALLCFAVFAADHPDDMAWESFYNPESKRQIVVLRSNRKPAQREWRPVPGRYLFQAEDLPDISDALKKWLTVWRKTVPSLGLLCDTIQQDTTYSVPRFLTLYTAAEGYWKNTKTGKANWSPQALARRAAVLPELTGATKRSLALIGASRDYHAHLAVGRAFSPQEIVDETFESTRRLQALLQACLLREIGLDTAEIERLFQQHYASWPVPSEPADLLDI